MLDNIKALCKSHGVSLAEVERTCGLAQHTIYRWDTSKPAVDKVKAVADYFGVTVNYLLERTEGAETGERHEF